MIEAEGKASSFEADRLYQNYLMAAKQRAAHMQMWAVATLAEADECDSASFPQPSQHSAPADGNGAHSGPAGGSSAQASSDGSDVGGADDRRLARLLTKRLLKQIRQVPSGHWAVEEKDIEKLKSKLEMKMLIDSVLLVETQEAFTDTMDSVTSAVAMLKQLKVSFTKQVAKLVTHIANKDKAQARESTKAQTQQVKQATDAAKAQAANALAQMKSKAAETPPFWKIDFHPLVENYHIPEFEPAGAQIDLDVPTVIDNHQGITSCEATAEVQICLGQFGARYKREASKAEDGKFQTPIFPKDGKAVFDNMFKQLPMPSKGVVVEASLPEGFPNMMKPVWLLGCDRGMHSIAGVPNGFASIRVQSSGSVRLIALEISSLAAALRLKLAKDEIGFNDLEPSLLACSAEDLKLMVGNGLKIHHVILKPQQAAYIPSGYVLAESVVQGILIYGARKSYMVSTQAALHSYECLIGLHRASQRDLVKMTAALAILKKQKQKDEDDE